MAVSTSSVGSTDAGSPSLPHAERPNALRGGLPALALLVLLLLALCGARGLASGSVSQVELLPTSNVEWLSDFASAVARSRREDKLLHVHFTQPETPLGPMMDQTLESLPVAQLAGAQFINLHLDARVDAQLFKNSIGSAGSLASCMLDARDSVNSPDVVAAAPGYVPVAAYLEWLSDAARGAQRLRSLRNTQHASVVERLELADLYAALGSVRRARQVLAGVTTDAREPCQALERLARLDVEAGQVARARDELERSRACSPGSTETVARSTLTEAMVLSSERRVSAAVELLTARVPELGRGADRDRATLLLAQLQHELTRDADALATLAALRTSAATSTSVRTAEDQTAHILQPAPGHVH